MRIFVFALMMAALFFGCLGGGQTKQSRQMSDRVGDQSRVMPMKSREGNWTKAAQGHGAAGPMSPEELARMEKASAPGANLSRDGGAPIP
ncbi:hypothetical protein LZC95_49305 [Pendulispora brunnea]|uniref:Lipoprotein n=1 Tax=Pendulispora brunnea TaxID=2905690 RepID=A0ABZ2KAP7_9BACT